MGIHNRRITNGQEVKQRNTSILKKCKLNHFFCIFDWKIFFYNGKQCLVRFVVNGI